ncbi:P-loop NTPase [Falsarthrobacter nasiphocae]|uniref:Iron-sulfur cluster carrier protein n=1 Tax=Falsarthrobacter nasiphocae TaxID=189863 RepID=A0AAE3YGA2_9MICC|nr:P-loop NTPase [Falsarthrobacter nasiphocae]MDR6891476.1 ATP-binding protein involved in chromosome partitioning [Falsarthrobacter nasiphocae]
MPEHPEAARGHAAREAILAQLASVQDPELRRGLVELGMISRVDVQPGGPAVVGLKLTIEACPKRGDLVAAVREASLRVVEDVDVEVTVMTPAERRDLVEQVRGAERDIPFARPESLTRVVAVASGKGGVGKSTVTANLALAAAARGLRVGVIDADIYGFSIPPLLGVTEGPTKVEDLMLPPVVHGISVMSIGMFVGSDQPISWRGPMLHRALEQFLKDTHFGDLDVLLLDLPPGTGDVPITVAQLLPGSGVLVVTTPQESAAAVAERSGALAGQTGQRVLGVVENMSWLEAGGQRLEPFGSGGGEAVARRLTERLAESHPEGVQLLARLPLADEVRDLPATGAHAPEFEALAERLFGAPRGLSGRPLGLTPA